MARPKRAVFYSCLEGFVYTNHRTFNAAIKYARRNKLSIIIKTSRRNRYWLDKFYKI